MSVLQIVWFGLVGVLLAGYMILDGFDLGVGFWHLFAKKDADRRALMASILPYWDGNEVWLLTGGGAVFAAFPKVYATVFSGFYLPLMLVLFALIFRAVSLEFRNQSDSIGWKRFWDGAFAFGSILPALLFGVAMGNIVCGLRLDSSGNFTGTFFSLLNPYSLLIGVTGLAMFAHHGALFASLKTTGELHKSMQKRAGVSGVIFVLLLMICLSITVATQARMMVNFYAYYALWILPAGAIAFAWASISASKLGKIMQAFLMSSACMIAIIATLAAGLFPIWVPAANDPSLNLTVANASSSELTLKTMLIITLIGLPIVLAYSAWVHMVFKGKVGEEVTY